MSFHRNKTFSSANFAGSGVASLVATVPTVPEEGIVGFISKTSDFFSSNCYIKSYGGMSDQLGLGVLLSSSGISFFSSLGDASSPNTVDSHELGWLSV